MPQYSVRHEGGSDWGVVDENGTVRASGLDLQEAEETAKRWNEKKYEKRT